MTAVIPYAYVSQGDGFLERADVLRIVGASPFPVTNFEAVMLWRMFSEEVYSAGGLVVTDDYLDQFAEWMQDAKAR